MEIKSFFPGLLVRLEITYKHWSDLGMQFDEILTWTDMSMFVAIVFLLKGNHCFYNKCLVL